MKEIQISIIIVTYNSEKDIYPCLKSIISSKTKLSYEIMVVDNDSTDSTYNIVEDFILENKNFKIELIKSKNKGFNAGNNMGIKHANGKYILLLNPDTEVSIDTLENLYNAAENIKGLGALGCVMKNEKDEEIFSAGYFPSVASGIRRLFMKNRVKVNRNIKLQSVDFPAGSTFLFKKSVIDEIGLMDENYFLFYDETDYAYQMKKIGYRSYIITYNDVIHKFGQSTSKIPEFSIRKSIESYFYFVNKNYNFFYGSIVKLVDLIVYLSWYLASHIYKKDKKKIFKFYLQTYLENMKSSR